MEMGEGPPVLLCHGFPESWYSWRYQVSPDKTSTLKRKLTASSCGLNLGHFSNVFYSHLQVFKVTVLILDPSIGTRRLQGVGSGHEGIRRINGSYR